MFRPWRLIPAVLFACAAAAAGAADTGVAAVGRLERLNSGSTCTGVLVRPDVVLTAAHCVQGDMASPERLSDLRFRPGAAGHGGMFSAKAVLLHPLYDPVHDNWLWRLRFDFAVVRLARPVPDDIAVPIGVGSQAEPGEKLFLVSWRPDGTPRPRQRACPVVPGLPGLVTVGCRVAAGESGAPLLRRSGDGLEIVAILSSRGQMLDQPVAQASDVALRLPPLLEGIDRLPPS